MSNESKAVQAKMSQPVTAVTPVNDPSEDFQTLLKDMANLKEESRLEKSKNTDVDCEYVYPLSVIIIQFIYSKLHGSEWGGGVSDISRHEYEVSQGHERSPRKNTPFWLVTRSEKSCHSWSGKLSV